MRGGGLAGCFDGWKGGGWVAGWVGCVLAISCAFVFCFACWVFIVLCSALPACLFVCLSVCLPVC